MQCRCRHVHTQYTRLADVTNRHKRKYKQKYMDRSIEKYIAFCSNRPTRHTEIHGGTGHRSKAQVRDREKDRVISPTQISAHTRIRYKDRSRIRCGKVVKETRWQNIDKQLRRQHSLSRRCRYCTGTCIQCRSIHADVCV